MRKTFNFSFYDLCVSFLTFPGQTKSFFFKKKDIYFIKFNGFMVYSNNVPSGIHEADKISAKLHGEN